MTHPYADAPGYRRWRQAMAAPAASEVDPVVTFPFQMTKTDKVVAAGSCFAQHISRHLREQGFNFLVTEPAHPLLDAATAEAMHYGVYSARYGNVYTSRQLLHLLRRAYGRFTPADDVWEQNGRYTDPFRPAIQPNGFATRQEYDADRRQHFAAVRRAFEEMDILVFTLGLTECWYDSIDGAAYPMCPGTIAGRFDPARHAFVNLGVEDVVADMTSFIAELRALNPGVRVILTVSPVPLAATGEDRHVLTATTYSKAVLRVAADILARLEGVAYFPSYEIIMSPSSRGAYFDDDLRSVREQGVAHVMRLFFKHAAGLTENAPAPTPQPAPTFLEEMRGVVDALCEEQQLDRD